MDNLIRNSNRTCHLFRGCLLLLLAALLTGCVSIVRPNYTQTLSELRSGDYSLDPEHVYVHFNIEHLGLSTIVGRFNSVEATLDFDPTSLEELQLDGVIDVASIDMNNESLENRLRGADWLNTQKFPEAQFQTTSITATQNNDFVIAGEFSLRGITRPMSLNATFKGGADNLLTGKYTLGFSANGSFLRSDFGIDAFAALVADEVFIEIHAEFQKNN
ncbi:MAG: polyisoprenoid-binding protein YceI [bacterium]|jgi:polyisoprenoid-binding protein YceI